MEEELIKPYTKRLTSQSHYEASIMLYNLKRGIIPDYVTWEIKEDHIKILEMFIVDGESIKGIARKGIFISRKGKLMDNDTIRYWIRRYLPNMQYDERPRFRRRNKMTAETRLFAYYKKTLPKTPCAECGATTKLELDHIKPACRGGKTEPNNLQWLCHTCHSQKTRREFGWDRPWGEVPDIAG